MIPSTVASLKTPTSFPNEKERSTIWNKRNITIGIAVVVVLTTAVASLYYINKPTPAIPKPLKAASEPPDLTKVQFMNKSFPLSKKNMWDEQQGSFVIENQIDKMSGLIQDIFYKGHVSWIAQEYDACANQVKKFMDTSCYSDRGQYFSRDCDSKFEMGQDTCSFARKAGEQFCSITLHESEFVDSRPELTNICNNVGLL